MENYASLTTTNTQTNATSATAVLSETVGKQYKVMGFDGSSIDQSFEVELWVDSSPKLKMHGSADTTSGRDFGNNGLVGKTLKVITTPASQGSCIANLIYKIVF